jgi:hypothetical protein
MARKILVRDNPELTEASAGVNASLGSDFSEEINLTFEYSVEHRCPVQGHPRTNQEHFN